MARMYLKRTLGGFALADEMSIETAKRYKVGETFRAEIVKPRSRKTLGRYWVLCQMILDNTEMFKTKEQVSDYLKIRTGNSTTIVAKSSGEMFHVANSISFDELDETQFQQFWSRVCDVVAEDIIPGISIDELNYEVQKLIGLAA